MKRMLGYILFGLGLAVFWPVQVGLWAYGIYYIVTSFIHGGILAGLISIPIVGISLTLLFCLLYVLTTPYRVLTAWLMGLGSSRQPNGHVG